MGRLVNVLSPYSSDRASFCPHTWLIIYVQSHFPSELWKYASLFFLYLVLLMRSMTSIQSWFPCTEGWIVPLPTKRCLQVRTPAMVSGVTFFGKMIGADIIKWRISRRDPVGWSLTLTAGVLIPREDTGRPREGHGKAETEMVSQWGDGTGGSHQSQGTGTQATLPLSLQKGPVLTTFCPNSVNYISVVWSHSVCDPLL